MRCLRRLAVLSILLPIIGNLLSSSNLLDDAHPDGGRSPSTMQVPPLGAGTWILRVEQAPASTPPEPPNEG